MYRERVPKNVYFLRNEKSCARSLRSSLVHITHSNT